MWECMYVYTRVLNVLFKMLESGGNCISLFRIGRTKNKSELAIVVYVKSKISCHWRLLYQIIRTIYAPKFPPNRNLNMEFLPGMLNKSISKSIQQARLMNDYPLNMQMGSNIGSSESQFSGALGGYINLKIVARIYHGFLINH